MALESLVDHRTVIVSAVERIVSRLSLVGYAKDHARAALHRQHCFLDGKSGGTSVLSEESHPWLVGHAVVRAAGHDSEGHAVARGVVDDNAGRTIGVQADDEVTRTRLRVKTRSA